MKVRDAILILLSGALLLLVAVYAGRVVSHYQADLPGGRVELGRVKMTQLDDAMVQRLASLQHDVLVTYYVSERRHLPSEMRRMEQEITRLLEAMQRASNGRLQFQIVDPESQPELVRHAAHQRVAPFRVRSIARDLYTEQTVWSTLHIAYGPHEAAVINGVTPEHLPRLQAMIGGQLDQRDHPRQPVFGIASEGGFSQLARWLEDSGRVVPVDMQSSEPIPDEVDVLFWMNPGQIEAATVRRLQRFLDTGRSAVIAGSRHRVHNLNRGELRLEPTPYDADFLLASFGLRAIDGLVLDDSSERLPGDVAPVPARFLVRCIPPNQDFREMHELPNGHLLFAAPTPMTFDPDVLSERGWSPTVLATTSDRTSLTDMAYGDVNLGSSAFHQGDPVAKLPLMVWLRPQETWGGSLVISGSASPFQDGTFQAPNYAHRRLVDVLRQTLASDDRLVIHHGTWQRTEPLPELTANQRLFWRIVCIGALPVLFVGVLLKRGGVRRDRLPRLSRVVAVARPVGVVAGLIVCVSVVVMLLPSVRADLTADGTNRLSRQSVALAQVSDQPIDVTLIFSRSQNLPPQLRQHVRHVRAMLSEFQRAGVPLNVQWLHPEDLDAEQREALEADGVTPVRVTTQDEDMTIVRTVYSAITFQSGDARELLQFPDRASFEQSEFRIAFALWRLSTGRRPHIAFAADVPRLSAAEAYHDFQQRSLLAPTGTDVYSIARQVLEQADFRVTHLNLRNPEMPDDLDMIVWLQPRRDILPMLDATVRQLHRGVPVLIAAQHYNMQARQYRGAEFETVYWPQPQVADIHLHYLPDLGVNLVRDVLFDELSGQMLLQTQVNRASGERDYEAQLSAMPFLVRASAANYASHPMMRNLGDQLLPFPAYWEIDQQQLAQHDLQVTPLIFSSQRTWSYNWTGGWLPSDLLAGPRSDEDDQPQWLGRLPLALLVEGRFPLPDQPLTERRPNEDTPVELVEDVDVRSRLMLLGNSEMFKNHRIRTDGYRADHLLLNAVSAMALDEDLAAIASHRRVSRGYDYVDASTRLRWRIIVLGVGPMLTIVLATVWLTVRRLPAKGAKP